MPNIFYTIRNIIDENDNGKNKNSIFYNEFDSVFKIKNDINFDNNILKINFKYEKKIFQNNEDNKATKKNDIIINEKNLVFVECKYEAN